MPWPIAVSRQFEKVAPFLGAPEANLYGAYNKLLNTLFPVNTKFTVSPRQVPNSCEAAGFLFTLEVLLEDKPVLILEIKPPSDLSVLARRKIADEQIRDRIRSIQDEHPPDVLYAVIAIGTRLCFYKKPRDGPIHPPIDPDAGSQMDTVPTEWWDCDVLEEDGIQRLQAAVDEINQGCGALA